MQPIDLQCTCRRIVDADSAVFNLVNKLNARDELIAFSTLREISYELFAFAGRQIRRDSKMLWLCVAIENSVNKG